MRYSCIIFHLVLTPSPQTYHMIDVFCILFIGQMFAVNRTAVNVATDPHEPPPNFAFLEILAEFSAKLMKQDKKTVRSIFVDVAVVL